MHETRINNEVREVPRLATSTCYVVNVALYREAGWYWVLDAQEERGPHMFR